MNNPVGYKKPDYSWSTALKNYGENRKMHYVKDGSGHRAGEQWGDEKKIDPYSQQRRYNDNNSPSFDEGVWLSKQKRRSTEKQSRPYRAGQKAYVAQKLASSIPSKLKTSVGKAPVNMLKAKIAKKI